MFDLVRKMKARKEYQCNGCKKPILPGQEYIRMVNPAWNDYEGDVDDEGRSIAFLRSEEERGFTTLRFHDGCDLVYWYGE